MNTIITKRTAVLGFGNPVREDDGVGVHVAQRLKELLAEGDQLSIFDMGTSAFEVLFQLRDHDRIILVDAVLNSGEEVGSVFKLPAEEIAAEVEDDPMVFLHSLKWHQALSYARKMLGEDYPEEVEVYLIAIQNTGFNLGMSDAARAGAEKVIEVLRKELSS